MSRLLLACLALSPFISGAVFFSAAVAATIGATRVHPVVASGRRHKKEPVRWRRRPWLSLPDAYNPSGTGLKLAEPSFAGPPRQVLPSYFAEHAGRVQHSLIRFRGEPVNINPPLAGGEAGNPVVARRDFLFAPPVDTDDILELERQRDQMLEFRDKAPGTNSLGAGIGAFAASLFLSAHGPRQLRLLFDGPIHLGPAIFDSGGVGMGLSGPLPTPPAPAPPEKSDSPVVVDGGTTG